MNKSNLFRKSSNIVWLALAILVISSLWVYGYSQFDPLQELDGYIENALEDWKIPGLALAIVKDDKVVYAKGYGVTKVHTSERININTLFAIASNTKAFTATALGILVNEGKIAWDDPVLKYLPDFQLYDPIATRKITIRDLLCHRSGLGKWSGDLIWFGSINSQEEVMRRIRFVEPVSDFRTIYGYSNLMFLVAGQIISRVTGLSWDKFILQRFFQPLGMDRSFTSVKDLSKMNNVATPHTLIENELSAINYVYADNCAPAGAIISCVNDIAQWLCLQLGNGTINGKQIVESEIITETRKPHTLIQITNKEQKINPFSHLSAYGLGWRLTDYRGRLLVNHTGGLDGMYSYVGFSPEENLGVVVLTNRDDHDLISALPYHIFDLFWEAQFQDWSKRYLAVHQENYNNQQKRIKEKMGGRKSDTVPSHPQFDYTGNYTSRVYGEAEIKKENGELKIRLLAHPHITGNLQHWQYDTFLAQWNDPVWKQSFVYFDLNGQGDIERFRISIRPDWIDTREYTFIKNH